MFNEVNFDPRRTGRFFINSLPARNAGFNRLSVFECPTDNDSLVDRVIVSMHANYAWWPNTWTVSFLRYTFAQLDPTSANRLGKTNYLPMNGQLGLGVPAQGLGNFISGPCEGVFNNRSTDKLSNAYDGTSNVMFFSEAASDITTSWIGNINYYSWAGASAMYSAGWGIYPNDIDTPQSRHAATINFGFGDGSVQVVNKTAARDPFIRLSGKADGFVVQISQVQ